MARATERPFGVSFAAGWAAISGALSLLQAVGMGVVGAAAPSPAGALLGLVLAVVQLFVGLGLLVVAGGLYRVHGWARLGGIVLFGVLALLNVYSLVAGNVGAAVGLGLNGTALVLLVVNRGAFTSDRPEVDDSTSVNSFR